MNLKRTILLITSIVLVVALLVMVLAFGKQAQLKIGDKIDSLNQVNVYYNGSMGNVSGRNVVNGYNLGLKYQCVEFVKRYYYEVYEHKMPNSYGHAKDFYNKKVKDGQLNKGRNLKQYSNPSKTKPKVGDLVVFDGHIFNKYGHVAIVSDVNNNKVELIQQNVGKTSRVKFSLVHHNGKWKIAHERILGFLRK